MKQILIVEDNQPIRDTLRMMLEMEGYAVTTASNGREALDKLKEIERPCLILLDLMMPAMNGWEFLEAQRADIHIATIPVLVTSAGIEKDSISSIAGFLKKPLEMDTLLAFVKRFCSPKA